MCSIFKNEIVAAFFLSLSFLCMHSPLKKKRNKTYPFCTTAPVLTPLCQKRGTPTTPPHTQPHTHIHFYHFIKKFHRHATPPTKTTPSPRPLPPVPPTAALLGRHRFLSRRFVVTIRKTDKRKYTLKRERLRNTPFPRPQRL